MDGGRLAPFETLKFSRYWAYEVVQDFLHPQLTVPPFATIASCISESVLLRAGKSQAKHCSDSMGKRLLLSHRK